MGLHYLGVSSELGGYFPAVTVGVTTSIPMLRGLMFVLCCPNSPYTTNSKYLLTYNVVNFVMSSLFVYLLVTFVPRVSWTGLSRTRSSVLRVYLPLFTLYSYSSF